MNEFNVFTFLETFLM